MTFTVVAAIALGLAALPAGMTLVNLLFYRAPRRSSVEGAADLPKTAVLIPARNEEPRIGRAVTAALASRGIDIEVVVMDDHSTDRTAEIVRDIAARDPRVRLETAPELAPGWGGKPHACQALADSTTAPVLLFVDADVTLQPDGVARAVRFLEDSRADLVSGFPRQITRTILEKTVIPLIHFVLLGYLPMPGMRFTNGEGFAAGCGQLMVVRRDAYRAIGGHATVKTSFHDGVKLPRAFRQAGKKTDLFDATPLASCRMYHDGREVIEGLAKNAHEGMGGPVGIWVWSVLLLGGHVLPALLVALGAVIAPASLGLRLAVTALVLGLANRLVLALCFRQSWVGALFHPFGVSVLVAIQWYARYRRDSGAAITWKDRVQIDG